MVNDEKTDYGIVCIHVSVAMAWARVNVCAMPPSRSIDAPVNSTAGWPSTISTCGRSRRPATDSANGVSA